MPFSSIAMTWGRVSSLVQSLLLGAILLAVILACAGASAALVWFGMEELELVW